MKGNMRVHYDEKGDFLEIGIGISKQCYAEEIEPGIFIRKDEQTDEVKSIGILGFKKRSKSLKDVMVRLPVDINFTYIESPSKAEA